MAESSASRAHSPCRKGVKCVVYVKVKQDRAQVQPDILQRACHDEAP